MRPKTYLAIDERIARVLAPERIDSARSTNLAPDFIPEADSLCPQTVCEALDTVI